MIIPIAWRSIWRRKRRTLITIASISLGLTCAIFLIALGDGVYQQLINDAVRMQAGHVTLEHEKYREAPALDLWVNHSTSLRRDLELFPEVEKTKLLVFGQGIAKSGHGSVGIQIMGIEPLVESQTSPLAKNLISGNYLEEKDNAQVVLGSQLAKHLKLRVGKKLVLMTNNAQGDLIEELCRVKGIFQTGSEEIDGYLIQTPIGFARRLFQMPPDGVTQLGILLNKPSAQKKILHQIKQNILPGHEPTLAVYPWEEIQPGLAAYIRMDKGSNLIFQGILLLLVLFTIFNTIFMSILERRREFSVLLALGTPAGWVKRQVLMESAFIAFFGCLAGVLLGSLVAYYFQVYGLDLSKLYPEGISISGFAVSTRMHAYLSASLLFWIFALVFGATLLLTWIPLRGINKLSIVDLLR